MQKIFKKRQPPFTFLHSIPKYTFCTSIRIIDWKFFEDSHILGKNLVFISPSSISYHNQFDQVHTLNMIVSCTKYMYSGGTCLPIYTTNAYVFCSRRIRRNLQNISTCFIFSTKKFAMKKIATVRVLQR